jgi:hypothetical protein
MVVIVSKEREKKPTFDEEGFKPIFLIENRARHNRNLSKKNPKIR